MAIPAKKKIPAKKVATLANDTTNSENTETTNTKEATPVADTKKKIIPKKLAPKAAPATEEKEEVKVPAKKPVPAKKVAPAAPAKKTVPAKKVVEPKEETTKPVAKKAPAAPAKKAPAKTAPVATVPASKKSPKVGSAKPAPKAPAPKAPAASSRKGGRITVGKRKETKGSNFEINYGGRTTREAFIHQAYQRLEDAGLGFDSKKTLTDVIGVLEELLVDITAVSSFKFMGAMFRLRKNKARIYSVPTTELDTLVPEHFKVLYSRYASPETEFLYGHHDADTGIFYPEGEEEGMFIGEVTTTKTSKAPVEDDETEEEEVEEVEEEEVEETEEEAEEEEVEESEEETEDEESEEETEEEETEEEEE